jgi:hypothetical protein
MSYLKETNMSVVEEGGWIFLGMSVNPGLWLGACSGALVPIKRRTQPKPSKKGSTPNAEHNSCDPHYSVLQS